MSDKKYLNESDVMDNYSNKTLQDDELSKVTGGAKLPDGVNPYYFNGEHDIKKLNSLKYIFFIKYTVRYIRINV